MIFWDFLYFPKPPMATIEHYFLSKGNVVISSHQLVILFLSRPFPLFDAWHLKRRLGLGKSLRRQFLHSRLPLIKLMSSFCSSVLSCLVFYVFLLEWLVLQNFPLWVTQSIMRSEASNLCILGKVQLLRGCWPIKSGHSTSVNSATLSVDPKRSTGW